jgi:Selenoprotein P, N terminal region.
MIRYLLKLLVAYLYVTNAIGETYRDEECPECEYEDVKPIQVSKHTGYSSPSKKAKSHKSKSATSKQTDSFPTMQEDSQNVDDDAVLWDEYVLKLHENTTK